MVTLATAQPGPVHEQDAQAFASTYAGTFMHELGHTLYLEHGGGLSLPAIDRDWLQAQL